MGHVCGMQKEHVYSVCGVCGQRLRLGLKGTSAAMSSASKNCGGAM